MPPRLVERERARRGAYPEIKGVGEGGRQQEVMERDTEQKGGGKGAREREKERERLLPE